MKAPSMISLSSPWPLSIHTLDGLLQSHWLLPIPETCIEEPPAERSHPFWYLSSEVKNLDMTLKLMYRVLVNHIESPGLLWGFCYPFLRNFRPQIEKSQEMTTIMTQEMRVGRRKSQKIVEVCQPRGSQRASLLRVRLTWVAAAFPGNQ